MSTAVEFKQVKRYYGKVKAVNNVTFSVKSGEFFSMLGPSGSGKTTCLRLIAGFEEPTSGNIILQGKPTNGLPPYDRNINTVFQDYALFPHMTILDNISYGLMIKKVKKKKRRDKALEMLTMVELPDMGDRYPGQLSGGQRQRVALARALINEPEVLLLDEPLGALDLKLRQQMQVELKSLQRKLGITFIYVTHDQEEALSMSDRLSVFNNGQLEQVGTPSEIYEKPASAFVSAFVGDSNLVEALLAEKLTGHRKPFSLRPEHIDFLSDDREITSDYIKTEVLVSEARYFGSTIKYLVDVEGIGKLEVSYNAANLLPDSESRLTLKPGDRKVIFWHRKRMNYFGEGEE